jgi:hypothetical protein
MRTHELRIQLSFQKKTEEFRLSRVSISEPSRRALLPALALLVAVAAALLPAPALAAPGFGEIIVSDENGASRSGDEFSPDTEKVYLKARLVDVPRGAKVTSSWIAVSTRVAPPDYLIDTAEITVAARVKAANFSLTRPDNGWPVGSYRVDLAIDGRKAGSASFKVK